MTSQNLILGLDIGTTNIKCLAIDDAGTIVAQSSERTPIAHPRPGWTDFEPDAIWNVGCSTIKAVISELQSHQNVRGIAVASVAESIIPIDAQGEALASAIAWFDLRTTREYEWLCDRIGYNKLFEISGLNPDPMFGICKILWVRNNHPDAFERAKYWLHMADYVAFRLSGIPATDPSLACRTLAYNLQRGGWETSLLENIGIDPSTLPPVLKSGTPLGSVTKKAAAETGLPSTTVVSVGSQDHISGSFAASGLGRNLLVDSIGTSESLMVVSDKPNFDPTLPEHGLAQGAVWIDERLCFLTGGIFTAGAAVEWFKRELGSNVEYADLIREATTVDEAIPLFLPHLARSLTPFPDARASGAFVGLKPNTTRAAMFRAVLEGVAFEARAILDAMMTIGGQTRPTQIVTIGASLQNRLLAQIKADIFGSPIKINPIREVVGFGAALLAGIGAELFAHPNQAVSIARQEEIEIEPDPKQSEKLQERYEAVYRGLYSQLQMTNHRLYALERKKDPGSDGNDPPQ
jgi:xylulokinase